MNFLTGNVTVNGTATFAQEGSSLTIPIPSSSAQKLRPVSGKGVILGIRPEHIYGTHPGGETSAPFSAQIEVVEPVGNEIFVYFTTGTGAQYVARLATDRPPTVDTTATLYLDSSKVHFFERDSERSL